MVLRPCCRQVRDMLRATVEVATVAARQERDVHNIAQAARAELETPNLDPHTISGDFEHEKRIVLSTGD